MYNFGAVDRVVNRPTGKAVAPVTTANRARPGGYPFSDPVYREARPLAAAHRALSELVAQLLAGRLGLPQTRYRCRAEPGEAAAAYAERRAGRAKPRAFGRRISILT